MLRGFPVTLCKGCPFVLFIRGLFQANSRTIGMCMSVGLRGSPCGSRKNSKCQFTLVNGPSALTSLSFPTDMNPGNNLRESPRRSRKKPNLLRRPWRRKDRPHTVNKPPYFTYGVMYHSATFTNRHPWKSSVMPPFGYGLSPVLYVWISLWRCCQQLKIQVF